MKLFAAALLIAAPVYASAGPYTLFAGNNVNLEQGTRVTGNVEAGGIVNAKYQSTVKGNVQANGAVNIEQAAVVNGNIESAGKVHMKYQSTATGKVSTSTTDNVAVTLEQGSVVGNVHHNTGTKLTANWGSSYVSDIVGPVSGPALDVLPGATAFSAGTTLFQLNASQTGALGKGQYGKINLGFDSTLTLSAGSYYFDSLEIGGDGKLIFDLAGGAINLYIKNNVSIGQNFEFETINGSASSIYTETLGNYDLGINGEWYGTLFGSGANSNLHFNQNSTIGGTFMARNNIQLDVGSVVTGLPSQPDKATPGNEIPLPGTFALMGLGLLALAGSRRRK
ncbi:polymer-forming cytoskeletal protein [Pseudoduganella sp. OTU4001]|uniref:polymer-forming cytoskeletal protein n=1 Tax=Pseudoduganella sp. OTU4001 TaxID=3043854 RepID=UPI00313AB598